MRKVALSTGRRDIVERNGSHDRSPSRLGDGGLEVAALRDELTQLRDELARSERALELALEVVNDSERRLSQVRALADLAEWAPVVVPSGRSGEPTIRVSDLRRALG